MATKCINFISMIVTSLVMTPEQQARWLSWAWPEQVQDGIMGAEGGVY